MREIPSVKLSREEEDNYKAIMVKGANLLRECADLLDMDHRPFRADIFKGRLPNYVLAPEIREKIELAVPAIMAIRQIEDRMLSGYIRLAKKHAKIWEGRVCGPIADRDDYLQEAIMCIVDAMYSFNRENVRFVTYLWYVIHNRLATAANKNNAFGPLSNNALKLLQAFEKAKQNMGYNASNVEVYEHMGLSEEDIGTLEMAMIKVVHPTASSGQDDSESMEWSGRLDYTGQRRGIDSEKDTVPCYFEVTEAVQKAQLNEVEQRVLDTYLNPHFGWQEEIASQTINPKTNKRYTRSAIAVILHSALRKVKANYQGNTAS